MELDGRNGDTIALDAFRVGAPAEIQSYLRRLSDANAPVVLNAPDGTHVTTSVWTIDAAGGRIGFAADARDERLQQLLLADEIVAVAYLDSIKLQWDVQGAMLVLGGTSSALRCAMPTQLYRFQRRNAYRVRPLPRPVPFAHLPNPDDESQRLSLRVLDVSIGGCALLLPPQAPSIELGATLAGVMLELDIETRLAVTLVVHHLGPVPAPQQGQRAGCGMVRLPGDVERLLQRFIDQTQKKRRMFPVDP